MAEVSMVTDTALDEEYGSEPANEVECDSPVLTRGRKRRSADFNNGLVSLMASASVEPKEPATGKRTRGEDSAGKRVRKVNPIYAEFAMAKKTAHACLGQEPTNGKGRKEVVIMTPAEARSKKLAKGYQYIPAVDEAKAQEATTPTGKRERKKPVHADFLVDDAGVVEKKKKISVTIANPNTNPTTINGSRRHTRGASTPEPALVDSDDKPAKRTKSEQSRQAKLDHTLTMLNDQLALVTSSIRNKEHTKSDISLPPVEPEAANGESHIQNDYEADDAEDDSLQSTPHPSTPQPGPHPPTSVVFSSSTPKSRYNKRSNRSSDHSNRKRTISPSDSPQPNLTPGARPVRRRTVRTPSAIAGDLSLSKGLIKCQELLREMLKHEHAWPFTKPVDPVALGIPDYFLIIKQPMDLGTIKAQLANGHYETVDAFADDVRLVFTNTRTYNQPESDIVYMAKSLEEVFDRGFNKIKSMTGYDHDIEDEEYIPPMSEADRQIQQLSSQLKEVTEELKQMKREWAPSSVGARASKVGRVPKDDSRPMSFDEKRRLSIGINALPTEKLGKVVQIIHERNSKLAQSSAPDEIVIDIDALDVSTLRHLEKYVRTSQPRRTTSSASASPAPNKLAQAELAASGTKERIADVKRQLDELNRTLGTKKKGNTKTSTHSLPGASKGTEDEDVVIDDEAPSNKPPLGDSDSGSSSESSSDSSSESDSSDTSSGSDSESDQEQKPRSQPGAPTKFPTITPNQTPHPSSTSHTTSHTTFTANGHTSSQQSIAPMVSSHTPPQREGVVFSLEKPQNPVVSSEPVDIPEIKASTSSKKAPEEVSWNTTVLETSTTQESPTIPPATAPTTTPVDSMWSQFQNKNNLQKQKEKEREEQEELIRREREEREEERRREDERRKKEQEEVEARKLRDSEAEKEQKKKEIMEQRAKAKEERERMQGKNMTEQFDVMASFERENRSMASLPSPSAFHLSSLGQLQTPGGVPSDAPPATPTFTSNSTSASTSAPPSTPA